MDLQTKQLADQNREALKANILIVGFTIFLTAYQLIAQTDMKLFIRLAVCLVDIIINFVAYRVFYKSETFRHVAAVSVAAVYAATLFTSTSIGMHTIAFPIALLLMIYSDKALTRLGSVVCITVMLGFDIMLYLQKKASIEEMVAELCYVVPAMLIALMVTQIHLVHNQENVEEVQKSADHNERTAQSIAGLALELNQKFESAQAVSGTLNDTVHTSNTSVSEIADSTRVNAEAIENQTVRTSEIQSSIQTVVEEAHSMGELSIRTNARVEEGVAVIEELKKQALEVEKINTETNQTTQSLNESIPDVHSITEPILGISSQTNLLALNASIEAARAGDAGRGFAVVANEIRKLSEDTRKATEQIVAIINRLTADAENASSSMLLSAEYAQKQHELIEIAGEKLLEIREDTDILHSGVTQVNSSIESINSANHIIMENITNLSAISEEVAASTDTALSISDSSMDALTNMNKLLKDINAISHQMEVIVGK